MSSPCLTCMLSVQLQHDALQTANSTRLSTAISLWLHIQLFHRILLLPLLLLTKQHGKWLGKSFQYFTRVMCKIFHKSLAEKEEKPPRLYGLFHFRDGKTEREKFLPYNQLSEQREVDRSSVGACSTRLLDSFQFHSMQLDVEQSWSCSSRSSKQNKFYIL